ncbi:armadillo/beta-catenin repeat protein (macronuclear) [Tetrahymena thermophila SB210]|uniref:Armadillo/beta-catenin repeat protein n=1 Tax=Tetrahymena thermophila (strain SB210) TaxID=312017 RepID=Q23MD9_TETTS|nr:armadillo/beta-catenin repeat protein [Tetrahymena thermophila SB210]EAR97700.1 armadillo/beta-catenin repeat protein [Tetrahymena thermophila SB210]|eukprot:XP_001017945.1 armadillo/beta-catenin repeat protein [Tetrahymena thermophila SB210]
MDIGQDEAQLVLQHKKDQFRVEIRKKKTDSLIQQKRLKLFNKNLTNLDSFSDADNSKSDQNTTQDPQNNILSQQQIQQQQVSTLDVQVIRDIESRLLQCQKDNNIEQMRSILIQLVKIVGTYPSPINQMFMTSLPKFVISIVNKHGPVNDPKCKNYAAHILANLTAGTPMQLQELFQLDLIHILIEQIQSKDVELADHVIWAFNNVLIDNHQPENLVRIFQERPLIIEDLCYYFTTSCNNPNIQFQLISSVILSIYCLSRIHKTTQSYYNQLRIAIPYLAKLLDVHHPKEPNTVINSMSSLPNKNKSMILSNNSNQNQMNSENCKPTNLQSTNSNIQKSDQQVKQKFLCSVDLKMCALIITDLSEGDPRVISDMLKIQVDRIMLRYLEQGIDVNEHFLTFVIRTLANMSSGNEFQTDQLLQKDIYSYLNRFLEHPKEQIRKDVCWLISNLSAGNASQIDVFLNKNMLQTLIQRLNVEQSIHVKKEILFALSNATAQATKEQINKMVSNGLLRVFSDNLDPQYETELLIEILEGIENVMMLGRSDDLNNNQNAYSHEFEGSGCQRKIQYLYYQKSDQTVVEISDRILRSYGTN